MKVLQAAVEAIKAGRASALVTVTKVGGSTPRSTGARMLVDHEGDIVGTIGGGTFEHRVIQQAIDAIRDNTPRSFAVHLTRDLGMCCGGAMEVYIEPLEPRPKLVIYGAGHVAHALVSMAQHLDFDLWVIDERDELCNDERFPAARRITTDPRRILDELPWGPHTYHLIVTHSHQLDQDLVEAILPRTTGWLGMIGSQTKVKKFHLRLRAGGMEPELFQHLSAPVGLDLGAETPAEIAVSILAEIVNVRRRTKASDT